MSTSRIRMRDALNLAELTNFPLYVHTILNFTILYVPFQDGVRHTNPEKKILTLIITINEFTLRIIVLSNKLPRLVAAGIKIAPKAKKDSGRR